MSIEVSESDIKSLSDKLDKLIDLQKQFVNELKIIRSSMQCHEDRLAQMNRRNGRR